MSPTPLFDDKQFKMVFQIKRRMVDEIINDLASRDPFWTLRRDATGKLSHLPVLKFLPAQKMLCYGVSVNAFKDYFQMGESNGNQCLSKLCVGMATSPWYLEFYLWAPTKSDAQQIVRLHKDEHGIDGMLGSLDVTKIHWANCPAAWNGQFEGKEGIPTIGLEAVADYNMWFWQSLFGFPGSLNDLNIWERSPLLESMIDGSHDLIDHPFIVNGQSFNQLYYLVDGIYPLLSRFAPTIPDPSTKLDQHFAKNQESFRKSIERAFGILNKKFLMLLSGLRFYERDEIYFMLSNVLSFITI